MHINTLAAGWTDISLGPGIRLVEHKDKGEFFLETLTYRVEFNSEGQAEIYDMEDDERITVYSDELVDLATILLLAHQEGLQRRVARQLTRENGLS